MIPIEIIGLRRPEITFVWEDDHTAKISAYELRLRCRCAICVEETSGEPLLNPDQVSRDVVAIHMELVGQYALAIHWSDGHTTSIYSFRTLRPESSI